MPFRSQAQRAYMHIHHPEIARRFEEETPRGAHLPQHVRPASPPDARQRLREEVMRRARARQR